MSEKSLAIQTLRTICEDKNAPATARASAARTLLETEGVIGRLQSTISFEGERPLHEMSGEELDREILARRAALDGDKRRASAAEAVPSTAPKPRRRKGRGGGARPSRQARQASGTRAREGPEARPAQGEGALSTAAVDMSTAGAPAGAPGAPGVPAGTPGETPGDFLGSV